MHPTIDTSLPDSAIILPFSEAIVETVPFYLLEFGKQMPNFTQFRAGLKESDILTVQDLWDGFSQYSGNPLATNRSYASALLLGVDVIYRLQQKYGVSKTESLSLWLDAMSKAINGRDSVRKTADILGVEKDTLLSSKDLQMEGQKVIGQV